MKNRAFAGVLASGLMVFLLTDIARSATTINSAVISGTQLTITGTGFSGTPLIVNFNGKSLPIVSSSSTQILATVNPFPAAGSYRLAVKSGTASTSSYVAISAPTVVATVTAFNQTAAIPTTIVWTPPTDGLYRISVYLAQTVIGGNSSNIWQANVSWTDITGPKSFSVLVSNEAIHDVLGGVPVRLLAGQPITYDVSDEGTGGAGTYEVLMTLERLM